MFIEIQNSENLEAIRVTILQFYKPYKFSTLEAIKNYKVIYAKLN